MGPKYKNPVTRIDYMNTSYTFCFDDILVVEYKLDQFMKVKFKREQTEAVITQSPQDKGQLGIIYLNFFTAWSNYATFNVEQE